jgi:hypothetical protein
MDTGWIQDIQPAMDTGHPAKIPEMDTGHPAKIPDILTENIGHPTNIEI